MAEWFKRRVCLPTGSLFAIVELHVIETATQVLSLIDREHNM